MYHVEQNVTTDGRKFWTVVGNFGGEHSRIIVRQFWNASRARSCASTLNAHEVKKRDAKRCLMSAGW